MDFIKFFREDWSEILGVYHDGETIYFARLADTIETATADFEIDLNDKTPAIEQLAEKIKLTCDKRGWKISTVGLILREGTAATFQTDFKNVPAAEIADAVKIWAMAHVKNARYSSVESGREIWMEALPAPVVEEYISAFEKNSIGLGALTEFPQILADDTRPPTPFSRAIFAADILKNKKSPNILSVEISTWNIKKISLTAAAIFLIALAGFSAKLTYDYLNAATRTETAIARLESQNDTFILKEDFDAVTGKIKRFDRLISTQDINFQNFNALVKLGQISDGTIIPEKIRTSGGSLEIEGSTETPDAVKVYLNRLKNIVAPKVKLKSSTEEDGQNFFTISVNLTP